MSDLEVVAVDVWATSFEQKETRHHVAIGSRHLVDDLLQLVGVLIGGGFVCFFEIWIAACGVGDCGGVCSSFATCCADRIPCRIRIEKCLPFFGVKGARCELRFHLHWSLFPLRHPHTLRYPGPIIAENITKRE